MGINWKRHLRKTSQIDRKKKKKTGHGTASAGEPPGHAPGEPPNTKKRPAKSGAKISRGTGRFPARHEYEKALCVQVNHLKQRQVILSDNVIVL